MSIISTREAVEFVEVTVEIRHVKTAVQRRRRAERIRRMFPARSFLLVMEWPRLGGLPSRGVA